MLQRLQYCLGRKRSAVRKRVALRTLLTFTVMLMRSFFVLLGHLAYVRTDKHTIHKITVYKRTLKRARLTLVNEWAQTLAQPPQTDHNHLFDRLFVNDC